MKSSFNVTSNRLIYTSPLLQKRLRTSHCRGRGIFLSPLILVTVRIIAHALNHNRRDVVPSARTFHLKTNHSLLGGNPVAVLPTLHHLITACNTAKMNGSFLGLSDFGSRHLASIRCEASRLLNMYPTIIIRSNSLSSEISQSTSLVPLALPYTAMGLCFAS